MLKQENFILFWEILFLHWYYCYFQFIDFYFHWYLLFHIWCSWIISYFPISFLADWNFLEESVWSNTQCMAWYKPIEQWENKNLNCSNILTFCFALISFFLYLMLMNYFIFSNINLADWDFLTESVWSNIQSMAWYKPTGQWANKNFRCSHIFTFCYTLLWYLLSYIWRSWLISYFPISILRIRISERSLFDQIFKA